ncbi:MAG: ABC transporter ATP-binding protein [Eubacteriales bacterium]|nr:ABC transporter ATP-binding protein [Eubacteriales bacterium]
MNTPLFTINHLDAWYRKDRLVLSDFSIALAEHEAVGLIGLNGAGKTTFFKVLSGLLPTFRTGEILFRGKPAAFRDEAFKRCRYTVFAEDHSFQYFTFAEYLSYVFSAYQKRQPDITELLQAFHFEDFTNVLLKDLSTGNRKKVFLITAFALKPPLLLLDEPVNGLDFQSTEAFYRLIADYKTVGTVLFSSHILESVTLSADRVLILENGQIRQAFSQGQLSGMNLREVLHE